VINGILNKRVQIAMGRKKYFYKDHIILCGLGRLGYFIADELFKKGNKIVIIESQNNSLNVDYFRKRNVEVYSGDARKADVLIDAGVESCQTLISVLDNDIANLEIGLVAKHYNPNIKLVLRIFDENMADIIKNKFNINLTNSMSYLTAKKFDNLFTDTKI
jgi:Trk K+ transport system NAD-binding subunit